jgi:hypothetical protein
MRVVRLYPDGLKLEEGGAPVPGEGDVLVRVHAAAITRGELEWPVGRLPAVPSHELSGVIAGTGEEVFALTPTAQHPQTSHRQRDARNARTHRSLVIRFNGDSGPVAQLVEQGTFNPKVAGSIPARPIAESPRTGGFPVVRSGGERAGVATRVATHGLRRA